MVKKEMELVITDLSTGNSRIIGVTKKEYESLTSRDGFQANNIEIPVYLRVAHVFEVELRRYFELLEEGTSMNAAFCTAFDIDAKMGLLRKIVALVAKGTIKEEKLHFKDLLKKLPESFQSNNMGKPLSNQDLNNEFYTWAGSDKLKENMQLRVAAVRFTQFIWHLFWNEKFQKQCRSF